MSESDNPQSPPEPDPAPGSSADGQTSAAKPLDPAPLTPVPEPQSIEGGALPTPPPTAPEGRLTRIKRTLFTRQSLWSVVAVLCLAGGTVASLLRAQTVVHGNNAAARQTLRMSSTDVAVRLKLATEHEEDLAIAAGTFFAGDPKASPAEFNAWAEWSQTLHRYPQLQKLGLVAIVRAPELSAFSARVAGEAPARPHSSLVAAKTAIARLRVLPAGSRPYYCLTAVELLRSSTERAPAGLDYCAITPGMLLARDAGRTTSTAVTVGHTSGLEIQMPIYRGAAEPATQAARMGAFAGWLTEVLTPGVMLEQALRDHPGDAIRIRYRTSSSHILFTSGTPRSNAPSIATNLHDGWTVRTYGSPPAAGVFADSEARGVLIAGSLLSLLLALLVFALGAGRTRSEESHEPQEELYDSLTGLPNRALMLDRAQRMLARAGRESGLLVGALFIDIDWFQDVNDKLGQATGDQLLQIVAERLENVVREQDSVGRLGGDEFVILVESAARGARLDSLARRVIESLHKPAELDDFGPNFLVTASIGVAFGRYATAEDMLRDARLALLAAKAAGKDRYTLFNANMRSVIEGRGVLEVELNTALQEKQFFLLYEPIYELETRKVAGLEAHLRWMHPKQGALAPTAFVPLAEETGLIVPIGRWVLEQACSRAATWNVAGHRVGVSVTISAAQLNREGFATDVRRALQQSGIDPSLLTLEIAESTVMHDVPAVAERLTEIKQLGVKLAIDDFGSAYANHSDLQRMPLDFLKVDRASLAATDDEDYRSWLLEAILVLGRDLSLTVVAKSIETDEQLSTLQAMGCTMAQGPFLSEPAPAKAIEGLFVAGDAPVETPVAVPVAAGEVVAVAADTPPTTEAPVAAEQAAAPAPADGVEAPVQSPSTLPS